MFGRKKRSRLEDIRIMNRLFPAADEAAAADGEPTAGAEYLLIAAFDLDDGSARRAFERVGATPTSSAERFEPNTLTPCVRSECGR